jgi:hypothetical protein
VDVNCPKCGYKLTMLFITSACDRCDGLVDPKLDSRGFVVLRRDRVLPCEEYVFETQSDAERWRELNGLHDAEIRGVRRSEPFRWQPSRGTVRGIILADRLFEIRKTAPEAFNPSVAVLTDGEV